MTFATTYLAAIILFIATWAANGLALHAARKRDAIARGL